MFKEVIIKLLILFKFPFLLPNTRVDNSGFVCSESRNNFLNSIYMIVTFAFVGAGVGMGLGVALQSR